MAMVCGGSRRMSSHPARGSIHFRASSPLLEGPMLMRSMTLAALSAPSASTSTLRRNSSTPSPTEVCVSATAEKLASVSLTSSRETPERRAIAMPTRCTSFAPMCLSTCAASCSPRLKSKIAARSVPVRFSTRSFILSNPGAYDLRDALRVLTHERACLRKLLLIGKRRTLCARERGGGRPGARVVRGGGRREGPALLLGPQAPARGGG